MSQMKEQLKNPEKNSNEMEITHLPDKELKEMVVRMLNKLKSRIQKLREHF